MTARSTETSLKQNSSCELVASRLNLGYMQYATVTSQKPVRI